ncbi:MAG: acetyl-CoA carboxylase biotin carboxyl carrier protein subunit, partial [Daejeonella sp.]|uniref:acetyl-CoA carboxylase biotin carboxyl carrier protein subunit n=1 Tax=Daejeonella sp. TaxID=2805397 RepID=UPI003C75DB90
IKVNEQFEFEVLSDKNGIIVDGRSLALDVYPVNPDTFHILHRNRSFNAELINLDQKLKTCTVRVNSQIYTLSLTDQFDELLHKLGMDNLNAQKVSELKAPMPGMVLKVLVAEGDEIKKGSALLILEAMKMENVIKAPADVVIKSIKVKPTDKVEKNQVMIVFG